ncbi:hypothetical protein [Amycolatopsis sp. CA-230715]|uniref:hypothetical protein n=1 Tax=Amycolatopsis sp. CA-230715 TaxID=2745196 RepID=UPI001C027AD5|nr:hypothetical protein [Amycolatopsis sp. CA-230715]QWF81147.1 hypothetical protein HUW46_04573 [Amycolatopsis sp. CA-230715]
MAPKPTTPPAAELAALRKAAAALAAAEQRVNKLRAERDAALAAARRAGATGDHLEEGSGINRRNVYRALATAGYDNNGNPVK